MRLWSETAERLGATSRTSEKVDRLAAYLRSLPPPDLPIAVVFMAGRPFPERDPRTPGLGWAAIASVAEELTSAPAGSLAAAYNASSDLGQAVGDLLAERGHQPLGDPPSVADVAAAFDAIARARGPAA